MRRLVIVCLACVPLGCGASPVTSPTPVSTSPSPPSPFASPFPPGATSGPNSVAGVITETTPQGARAVGGVSVSAWVDLGSSGYSYQWANGPRATDPAGRYQLANLPDGANVTLSIWKDGYAQQCAAPTLSPSGEATLDLRIVSKSALSADPSSVPPQPAGYRIITGMVFENSSEGWRPLPGAFVDFEPIMDFPAALTYSD